MSRPTQAKRIERLEKKRDEYISIRYVIARTDSKSGFTYSNAYNSIGKCESKVFPNNDKFLAYLELLKMRKPDASFSTFLDDTCLSVGMDILYKVLERADIDSLSIIASGELTEEDIRDLKAACQQQIGQELYQNGIK